MENKQLLITDLLDRISDPLVKAFESIRVATQNKDKTLIESNTLVFIRTLMTLGEDKRLIDLLKEASDPFIDYFRNVSKEVLPRLIIDYANFRLQMNVKPVDGINSIISLVRHDKEIDLLVKENILQKLYHMRIDFIIESKLSSDSSIKENLIYAKDKKDKELLKKIRKYCSLRLKQIQKPSSIDAMKDVQIFWELISEISPKQKPKVEKIILTTDVLMRRHTWGENKFPCVKKEDVSNYIDTAIGVSIRLFKKQKKDLWFVYNLFKDNEDQTIVEKYPILKTMIEAFCLEVFNSKRHLDSFNKCKDLLLRYEVEISDKKSVEDSIVNLLINGEIELADSIREMMGWFRDSILIEKATDSIIAIVNQKLIESNKFSDELLSRFSYSSSSKKETFMSKGFKEVVDLNKRIGYLSNYLISGISSVESIPDSDLETSYSGKILLFEFKGKKFLRTLSGTGGDMHRDIGEKFSKEIKSFGFAEQPEEIGGAHIKVQENEKKIKIYDRSEDFGECDKEIAKDLVQSNFPDWIIITEKYKGY